MIVPANTVNCQQVDGRRDGLLTVAHKRPLNVGLSFRGCLDGALHVFLQPDHRIGIAGFDAFEIDVQGDNRANQGLLVDQLPDNAEPVVRNGREITAPRWIEFDRVFLRVPPKLVPDLGSGVTIFTVESVEGQVVPRDRKICHFSDCLCNPVYTRSPVGTLLELRCGTRRARALYLALFSAGAYATRDLILRRRTTT
jgi:hypothetical protein